MTPAGAENGIGIITSGFGKDPTDPAFKDDPGMKEWRAFMAKYMPGADLTDNNYVYGYGVSTVLMQVLNQCNGDFSRANIMKQAANLHDAPDPVLLPGIKVNTFTLTLMQVLRIFAVTNWRKALKEKTTIPPKANFGPI